VRGRLLGRLILIVAATVLMLAATVFSLSQDAPAGGARGGARGGGGGRGANAAASQPTPRLPDGTVNLGRSPGDVNGMWQLPYIQNMANQATNRPQQPAAGAGRGGARGGARGGGAAGAAAAPPPPAAAQGGRGGPGVAAAPDGADAGTSGGRGLRGGAASEPWIPFLPWSAAVYNYHSKNESKYDPEGFCLPPGGPRLYATPYPMVVLQQPELKRIYMNFEGGTHVWREIFMDGRSHPAKDQLQGATWLGHSVGRWEGDTLVVDVTNFNEGTWLDYYGHPHTDQMHVIERWTRPNKGTLHYEATIDDPGAYSAQWTIAWDLPWSDDAIDEYICQENNQYLNHLKDDFGRYIIDHGEEYPKF
jgi:hypothetical protein